MVMKSNIPDSDERTIAVENSAGNLAFIAMSWFLVADMLLRAIAPARVNFRGFPVDIPVILLGGGIIRLWETRRNEALPPRRVRAILLAILVGIMVGAAAILLRRGY